MPTPTPYPDIYLRDNYDDKGTIPSAGNPYASPDIIPLQSGMLGWPRAKDSYPNPPDLGLAIVSKGVTTSISAPRTTARSPARPRRSSIGRKPRLFHPHSGTPSAPRPDRPSRPCSTSTIRHHPGGAICLSNPAFSMTACDAAARRPLLPGRRAPDRTHQCPCRNPSLQCGDGAWIRTIRSRLAQHQHPQRTNADGPLLRIWKHRCRRWRFPLQDAVRRLCRQHAAAV